MLQNTDTGNALASLFEDFSDWLCDIRNLDSLTDETRKARIDLAKLLEKEFVDRLRLHNKGEVQTGTNQYA